MYNISRASASLVHVTQNQVNQSIQRISPVQALASQTLLENNNGDTSRSSTPSTPNINRYRSLSFNNAASNKTILPSRPKESLTSKVLEKNLMPHNPTTSQEQAVSIADTTWQQRQGNTVVDMACKNAFKELKKQSKKLFNPINMKQTIKQHFLCEAALLCDNHLNSFNEAEKKLNPSEKKAIAKNKEQSAQQVKIMMSDWIEIPIASAGSSLINSKLRSHIDKCKLDSDLTCPTELKQDVRQLIGEKIKQQRESTTEMLLNSYLAKHPILTSSGEPIDCEQVKLKTARAISIAEQKQSTQAGEELTDNMDISQAKRRSKSLTLPMVMPLNNELKLSDSKTKETHNTEKDTLKTKKRSKSLTLPMIKALNHELTLDSARTRRILKIEDGVDRVGHWIQSIEQAPTLPIMTSEQQLSIPTTNTSMANKSL